MDHLEELKNKLSEFNEKQKFNDIIELLDNATLLKYNDAYLYAWLAWAYWRSGQNDKALDFYTKAINLNDSYHNAFYNRSIVWRQNGDYDKALLDADKAIELANEDSDSYNIRGSVWLSKQDYDKAILDYNKALSLEPNNPRSYASRGFVNYAIGNFQNAIDDYNKALEIDSKQFDFLNYRIKLAQEKLEERKILEQTNALRKDKDTKVYLENKIQQIINRIREVAKSSVKTVVHYTKVSVADIYVKKLAVKMHYSNAIYMNDPMEGKVFFEYLDDKTIQEAYENGEKRTETSVYLGSFLPAEENNGEISHEDELVMWRTYGKDENGQEAAGCCVVLGSDFFKVESSTKGSETTNIDQEEELLNVIYIRKQKDKREVVDDIDHKIENLVDELKKNQKKLIKIRNKYDKKQDFYKDIENTIFKQLSTISYLFKSSDYSFEKEVRVIVYMPRDSDSIKYRNVEEANLPSKRFYIESYNDILPYIKKLFLGPKVINYQQWSLYLDYEIRQRAKELVSIKDAAYSIVPSDIEIMKSDCKFQ